MSTATKKPDTHPSDPKPITGLSTAEVQARIAREQTNHFEARVGRTYWQILNDNIFNIFNMMLFILLLIVLISRDYATVLFAGFSVVGNSLIGAVQEINAKRKLDQLAQLSDQQVIVLRDGEERTISNQNVVIDDVIRIQPGDRLVVDGRIVYSDSLEIDESHLTGESDPVHKSVDDPVQSGSFCIAGAGWMRAEKVGKDSTINKLSVTAKAYKNILTPTQMKLASIVQLTLLILAIFGPMIFISGSMTGITFLEVIRNTVVFVTSLVPQGLILVATISLTIGAVKISRHQTLIQRVNAVESLGNATMLCFDKTGTITRNQLSVTRIISLNGDSTDSIEGELGRYISQLAHQNTTAAAIARHVLNNDHAPETAVKQQEIPFTSQRKWGAVVWSDETLVLGAPERVLGENHAFADDVSALSDDGLRVVALARCAIPPDGNIISDAEPLALVAIRDEIRDDIRATLDDFRAQQVGLKVISGDNLRTVRAIARQAGITAEYACTGDELNAMSETEFREAVIRTELFARIEPETKRRIIAVLRGTGEYVAMVGDGVNDVPALKEADLAVVMDDGAQISKDVADIVLLNNAMSTLPLAFREGTEITQTIYGTTKMFLAKNTYNTLLFIFVLFMSLPFPITPIQISWGAFGTTNMPAGFMALGIIRPKKIRNFRDDVLDYIFTAGITGSIGLTIIFAVSYFYTENLEVARHATTVGFIAFGLFIVWTVGGIDLLRPRTLKNNLPLLFISTLLTSSTLFVATLMPDLFEFGWPPLPILGFIAAVQLLMAAIISIGMRRRGLLYQFYSLLQRD